MSFFAKLIIYLFLFYFSLLGFGQASNIINFSSWQKEDGLPSNNTQAVEKDNLGFLWIATNDGLCRYDGPNLVKVYRQSEDKKTASNSLQSNNIRALHFDSQGFLWIGTRFGGLTRFHPSTNEWTTFRNDAERANSLSHDEVLAIFEDSEQNIWIGTEKGLNLFDQTNSTFTRFKFFGIDKIETTPKAVLSIMEDKEGRIWVGTWAGGLHLILKDEQGRFETEKTRHIQTTSDKAANNVWSLFQDNKNRFWIGSHGGGLLLMNLPTNTSNLSNKQDWQPTFLTYISESENAVVLESNAIQSILQDQFDNLWIGTTHGLYRVLGETLPSLNTPHQEPMLFQQFLNTPNDKTTIAGNNIIDILEDEQGLIWFGTTEGLSQYNLYSNQFDNFDFDLKEHDLFFAPNFLVTKDKDIWIGASNGGLLRYKFKNQKLVKDKDLSDLIQNKQVLTIYSPDDEWVYVGTALGITAIEMKSLKTKKYPIPEWVKSNISNLVITTIFEDKDGFIWFGTKLGLFRIDPITDLFSLYEPNPNDPNSISDHPINYIMQDRAGAIWVATYKGLNRIKNPTEDELIFEKFFYNEENPEKGLVTNEVMYLKEIDTYLYIGTQSGICRYDFSTNEFESFNAQKYWVRSIEEGVDNNVWFSTSEGIFHFDAAKKTFRNFDQKDGLANVVFQLGCSFKDEDGHIYFAFKDGFTCFKPKDLSSNEVAPPVYITEIERVSPKGTVLNEGIYTDQITLNHDDYRLSINFTALNYNRGDKNKYVYRLVGFEDHWNEGQLGAPIVYTSLKPETYTLEVRAANNDGIWNEEGVSLKIVKKAAYWETWWFPLLALAFVVLTVFSIAYWYTNKIRKHNDDLQAYNNNLNEEIAHRKRVEQQLNDYNEELKQSNEDLEQFAYIASHDLKEPLRVIGSFSGLLAHKYSNQLDDGALEYIDFIEDGVKRMSNLIQSLLNYSIVGRKDSVFDSIKLSNILGSKKSDLSQLIKDKNALVEIDELPNIIGQKEQIGMVFFNLINNAIKFNTKEQPHIIIKEEDSDDQFWKFSVSDNGIGIEQKYKENVFAIFKRLHSKQEYEGTGIGLSVCQKIISRHQGRIWFESELNKGTTFYFTIKKNLSRKSIEEQEEEMLQLSDQL